MTSKLNIIAIWSGIVGAAAAVYFPVRSEIKSVNQAEVQRAAQRQKAFDALYTRIGNDEADIAFIKSQMPKDKQDILEAIWRVRESSRAQETSLLMDKRKPVLPSQEEWNKIINNGPAEVGGEKKTTPKEEK